MIDFEVYQYWERGIRYQLRRAGHAGPFVSQIMLELKELEDYVELAILVGAGPDVYDEIEERGATLHRRAREYAERERALYEDSAHE